MSVDLSIVIPIYNEEGILSASVIELCDKLSRERWSYQILLSENGSRDRTVDIGAELAARFPQVSIHSLGQPNYGEALKQGILRAQGTFVVCDEIDLCDVGFYLRALPLLERREADMVVGSKAMQGAHDKRPAFRRMATQVINGMLRVAVGFKGTDTHGLKAFRRSALLDTVGHCVVDRDLFASELVIRAGREGLAVVEIPLDVTEKRPPSINLVRRVPNVLKNLIKLTYAIRTGKKPPSRRK